jgi:hypothetical protein
LAAVQRQTWGLAAFWILDFGFWEWGSLNSLIAVFLEHYKFELRHSIRAHPWFTIRIFNHGWADLDGWEESELGGSV